MIEKQKGLIKPLASLALGALVMPTAFAQVAPTAVWDAPSEGPVPEIYNLYGSKTPLTTPEQSGALKIGATTNLTLKLPTLSPGLWYLGVTAANKVGESDFARAEFLSPVVVQPPTNLRLESGTNYMFPLKIIVDKSPSNVVFGDGMYVFYRRNRFPETSTWFRVTETRNNFYSAQILQAGEFVYRATFRKGTQESAFSSNEIIVKVQLAARELR